MSNGKHSDLNREMRVDKLVKSIPFDKAQAFHSLGDYVIDVVLEEEPRVKPHTEVRYVPDSC